MTNAMTPSEIADWLDGEAGFWGSCSMSKESALTSQAAATIRAQAEALKIATEALEDFSSRSVFARHALARMKEVGA